MSDDLGATATVAAPESSGRPTLVLELSGAGAYVANPYVEYKGWTFDTGSGRGARLEANLIGADLIGADLIMANLTGANLSRADLSRAQIIKTDLVGANLSAANLVEAVDFH